MSAQGCGFPINAAVMCGEWSVLTSGPFLCPACQPALVLCEGIACDAYPCRINKPVVLDGLRLCTGCAARYLRSPALSPAGYECEGCRSAPAIRTRPPYLCDQCEAEYAADLAQLDRDDGDPGSRCSAGCGYCGRCGGA